MARAKKEAPKFLVCKYAGDAEDEFCSQCDGIMMDADGEDIPATECGGYEAVEVEQEVEKEVQEDLPFDPDVKEKPVPTEAIHSETVRDTESDVKNDTATTYVPTGVTTTIKAESGVSVELKDRSGSSRWYKFMYSEERTLAENCNVELEKEALWNDVNRTVDNQVDETMRFLNSI